MANKLPDFITADDLATLRTLIANRRMELNSRTREYLWRRGAFRNAADNLKDKYLQSVRTEEANLEKLFVNVSYGYEAQFPQRRRALRKQVEQDRIRAEQQKQAWEEATKPKRKRVGKRLPHTKDETGTVPKTTPKKVAKKKVGHRTTTIIPPENR